jgi:hypothetical protein
LPPAGICPNPTRPGLPQTPLRGGVRVMITGPEGFDRTVTFDLAEEPAVITQRIREMIAD